MYLYSKGGATRCYALRLDVHDRDEVVKEADGCDGQGEQARREQHLLDPLLAWRIAKRNETHAC